MNLSKSRKPRLPASRRFEFQHPIGSGGMGTVYRGLDRQTGEPVAIKVLRAKMSENPTLHQRLAREFRAASQLEHPNIVRAIALENDGESSFVVFELVEGGSLTDRIDRSGPLTEADAVRIVTQVAQALHYAHLHKVVHRDVKPENILVLPDGRAKLTDFGLAKDYTQGSGYDLTQAATGLGTPNYMAPEQFANARSAGVLCDVYSLGATLYTLVTGLLPYDAATPLAILTKKEVGPVPSAKAEVQMLTDRTEAAIRAALDPDPARRPQSCLEFFRLLTTRRRVAADTVITPEPPPPPVEDNRRVWVRRRMKVGSTGLVDTSLPPAAPAEESWPLVVQDVSAGGVGLLLARRFEPGTDLVLELPDGAGPPRRFATKVVRVQRERAGHWVHGCAFSAPLAEPDMAFLLAFS